MVYQLTFESFKVLNDRPEDLKQIAELSQLVLDLTLGCFLLPYNLERFKEIYKKDFIIDSDKNEIEIEGHVFKRYGQTWYEDSDLIKEVYTMITEKIHSPDPTDRKVYMNLATQLLGSLPDITITPMIFSYYKGLIEFHLLFKVLK